MLCYYLRERPSVLDTFTIESLPEGEDATQLKGFVRWTPEITKGEDITEDRIQDYRAEVQAIVDLRKNS
jgi:hypothetical protein